MKRLLYKRVCLRPCLYSDIVQHSYKNSLGQLADIICANRATRAAFYLHEAQIGESVELFRFVLDFGGGSVFEEEAEMSVAETIEWNLDFYRLVPFGLGLVPVADGLNSRQQINLQIRKPYFTGMLQAEMASP